MDAGDAVGALIDRVRARPWGLAAVAIDGDATEIRIDAGRDPIGADTTFQIGSVTKTITGVLLATCIQRGETTLDATVGDVLGTRAGRLADVTLRAVATHRSGLPRLPPNLEPVDQADPYAAYSVEDLYASLEVVDLDPAAAFAYSNYGFMLLGRLVEELAGKPYADLAADRVFRPLQLTTAGCPPPEAGRAPGYGDATEAPWWRTSVPGAGGVGMSITDLGSYLRAHLDGSGDAALDEALDLAVTMQADPPNGVGLGWIHQGGGWWHNGGTGGFTSFVALHVPTRKAVGLLANGHGLTTLDTAGFAVLTEMLRP